MLQRYIVLSPGDPELRRIGMRVEHGQIDIGRTDCDGRTLTELQTDHRPGCRADLADTERWPALTGHRQIAINELREDPDHEAGRRYRGEA
jgi:hypothetical protein